MRRLASSPPRRGGMETIRGLDKSISGDGNFYIAPGRSFNRHSSACSSANAGTTATGGRGLLAGRIAGGAGIAGLPALALHLMPGRVTGGTRLAERRAMLLHPLAGRLPLGRALSMAGGGGRNQQSRRRGNR